MVVVMVLSSCPCSRSSPAPSIIMVLMLVLVVVLVLVLVLVLSVGLAVRLVALKTLVRLSGAIIAAATAVHIQLQPHTHARKELNNGYKLLTPTRLLHWQIQPVYAMRVSTPTTINSRA